MQGQQFTKRNSHDQDWLADLGVQLNCAVVCAWLDESARRQQHRQNPVQDALTE